MQTNRNARPRHVQSAQPANAYAKYMKKDHRPQLFALAALCLLLPPVGILLVWRMEKTEMSVRAALSAVGLLSCIFIFMLLLRPKAVVSTIQPVPETPLQAGFGSAASAQYAEVPIPEATNIPAQPEVVITLSTADPSLVQQEPDVLTDDSIVYAVTNNASSYHLYEICDQQENHRALTLRDALNEGLAPCEKCVGAVG